MHPSPACGRPPVAATAVVLKPLPPPSMSSSSPGSGEEAAASESRRGREATCGSGRDRSTAGRSGRRAAASKIGTGEGGGRRIWAREGRRHRPRPPPESSSRGGGAPSRRGGGGAPPWPRRSLPAYARGEKEREGEERKSEIEGEENIRGG